MPDRVFPGSPTHRLGWDRWMAAFVNDWQDAQDEALRKLVLTRIPEICDTHSSEIHWLEKHVAQIQSGDTR